MAIGRYNKYGLNIATSTDTANLELFCIRKGGQWRSKNPSKHLCGKGSFFHYKEFVKLVWPEIKQHRWFDFLLERWLKHTYVGIIGPKSSGKTHCAAIFHLVFYYANSTSTTIMVCSTTRESLQNRIWGEIKKYHKMAVARKPWLPGHIIDSKLRIVTDDKDEASEGRDFRNGLMGIPLKRGGSMVSMSEFVGLKNANIMLCGDELQALPMGFIDAIANLSGNRGFKCTGMGNPKETLDPLGRLCEPAAHLGGWDGGIDQKPGTKSWETHFPNGICVQLPGDDSPNYDVPRDQPAPYDFLITPKQMDQDAKTWGKNDWHYTMFNLGRMPRGQGSNRVITRALCERRHALDQPLWKDSQQTWIAFLDAAYRAVGGDRCVFGFLKFGVEAMPAITPAGELNVSGLAIQDDNPNEPKTVLALLETKVIPITGDVAAKVEDSEDQIVKFVMSECRAYNVPPENFFFDSGMRTGLVSAFCRLWSPSVNPIDCGGKPSDRKVSGGIDMKCCDYYSKRITEFWYSVRLIIEAGQFRGLTEEVMLEGCAREFKTVAGNKIEVESKDDMKEKTGRSPDLFDALAVGVEGARQRGFVIAKLEAENEEATERDSSWKRKLGDMAKKFWRSGSLQHAA